MMMRDALVSMQFLNSIVRVEEASDYFYGDTKNTKVPAMVEFFVHVSRAERLGGSLDLRNGAARGVEVTLTLPAGG